jgi:site-specific DNA-methyltransferase (adenine-specific)
MEFKLNKIINADCMDVMKNIPDKYFELAIVDPPYGKKQKANVGKKTTNHKKITWDNEIPPIEYFNELMRISKNQIIWGGNYFIDKLYPTPCFIIWDKNNGDSLFADAELSWTSFNTPTRLIKITWCGSSAKWETGCNKIHPTQKPVNLYRWLLQNYAKPGDKIIDTHSGSGSCAIACQLEGHDFLAIEQDFDYWEASIERYNIEIAQVKLFA